MKNARSRPCLGLLAGLSIVLSSGCTIENPSHCGNLEGHVTCRARADALQYCDLCESKNDGCTSEPSSKPDCRPTDSALDTTSTESSMATTSESDDGHSTATSGHADATSAGSTAPGESSASSDSDEGASSESNGEIETGGPGCGNGIKEDDEDCDGTDFGGQSCQSLNDGDPYWQGDLMCTATCKIYDGECCLGVGAPCLVDPVLNDCCGECVLQNDLSTACGAAPP
jgi:hypothetical protein